MASTEYIYKGYWWIPSCPEKQTAGILTIVNDGAITLELLGMLGDRECELDSDYNEDVIYGRCYDSQNHLKDISLFDCSSSFILNFSSTFPLFKYHCRYALVGIHLESMNCKSFFKAYACIDELSYWCPPSNIRMSHSKDSVSITLNTLSGEDAVIDTIDLDVGVRLELVRAYVHRLDLYKPYIESSTGLRISAEKLSAKEVLHNVRRFEELLSVLTLSSSVEHSKIILSSNDIYQEFPNGERIYHPIYFYTKLYKADKRSDVRKQSFLCMYSDISSDIHDGIKRFYSNPSITHIWNNLIDSLEIRKVYSSNDFLLVVQALDGFSIRFRKESKSFFDQLKDLRDEFKSIDKVCLTDDDLKAVRDSRHYYSHMLSLKKKQTRNVLDGSHLYVLTKKLRILLICCVLNFLGLNNDVINGLLNKSANQILYIPD